MNRLDSFFFFFKQITRYGASYNSGTSKGREAAGLSEFKTGLHRPVSKEGSGDGGRSNTSCYYISLNPRLILYILTSQTK